MFIISYHIISYHIISYHIISYHIISYHIISYHIISYHIISYHIISYHIISSYHHIISYQRYIYTARNCIQVFFLKCALIVVLFICSNYIEYTKFSYIGLVNMLVQHLPISSDATCWARFNAFPDNFA